MQTRVIELDPLDNNRQSIQEAVEVLTKGGIVALPTETVYGLSADVFNSEAVAQIFAVKQRPSFDPLIVHIHHGKFLETVATIPEGLESIVTSLTKQFWPGPLTIILPKKADIPDIVTSGLPSVAVRVPAHPIMRGVIKALGHPLAAPSANKFGHISPTSARAVLAEFNGEIPMILDGGACSEGLESTIVRPEFDEKGRPCLAILRAGPITREQMKKIAPIRKPAKALKKSSVDTVGTPGEVPAPDSPGQLPSHYAPRKPFFLCEDAENFIPQEGVRYALLCFEGDDSPLLDLCDWEKIVAMSPGSGRLSEAAVRLFALMRQLDEDEEIDVIVAEPVSEAGIGAAIMDRMRRASGPKS